MQPYSTTERMTAMEELILHAQNIEACTDQYYGNVAFAADAAVQHETALMQRGLHTPNQDQ